MVIHFCAACDWSVSEQELLSGDAVKLDLEHVYCSRCVKSGVLRLPRMKPEGEAAAAISTVISPPAAASIAMAPARTAGDSGLLAGAGSGSKSGFHSARKSGLHAAPRGGRTSGAGGSSGLNRAINIKKGRTSVLLRAVSESGPLPEGKPLVVGSGPRLMSVGAPAARARQSEPPVRSRDPKSQSETLIVVGGTMFAVVLVIMVVVLGGRKTPVAEKPQSKPSLESSSLKPMAERAPAVPPIRPNERGFAPDPVSGKAVGTANRTEAEEAPRGGIATGLVSP